MPSTYEGGSLESKESSSESSAQTMGAVSASETSSEEESKSLSQHCIVLFLWNLSQDEVCGPLHRNATIKKNRSIGTGMATIAKCILTEK